MDGLREDLLARSRQQSKADRPLYSAFMKLNCVTLILPAGLSGGEDGT